MVAWCTYKTLERGVSDKNIIRMISFFQFVKGIIPDIRGRDDDETGSFEFLNIVVSTCELDEHIKQLYWVVDVETDYNTIEEVWGDWGFERLMESAVFAR